MIDSRNRAVYAALDKFLCEYGWTAAQTMQDRLKQPGLTVIENDELFAATPLAVAKFVKAYALEEDTSLCDTLVAEIAAALSLDSAVPTP